MTKETHVMNIWDKLSEGVYDNQSECPQKPLRPVLTKDATPAQIRAYADQIEMYDAHLKEYREQLNHYNARTRQLEDVFKADLEAEFGMVGHVKADLLYSKAWQMGHAHGLREVANYYSDLVELVL